MQGDKGLQIFLRDGLWACIDQTSLRRSATSIKAARVPGSKDNHAELSDFLSRFPPTPIPGHKANTFARGQNFAIACCSKTETGSGDIPRASRSGANITNHEPAPVKPFVNVRARVVCSVFFEKNCLWPRETRHSRL